MKVDERVALSVLATEALSRADMMQHCEAVPHIVGWMVNNGVTVLKWIPASDPPKEDGTYIVKTARGTVTTARFYAFKSFPATKYLPATHRSPTWQSNRNVTHWRPLPEAPKEVE